MRALVNCRQQAQAVVAWIEFTGGFVVIGTAMGGKTRFPSRDLTNENRRFTTAIGRCQSSRTTAVSARSMSAVAGNRRSKASPIRRIQRIVNGGCSSNGIVAIIRRLYRARWHLSKILGGGPSPAAAAATPSIHEAAMPS
jgi:hypothetical protein